MAQKNISGVTYFKLEDRYPGDETKRCGLTGIEIDKNFHFLRGKDIKSASIDGENGYLVFTLLNGEKIVISNFSEYVASLASAISSVTYNDEFGVLSIYTSDNVFDISGFTISSQIKSVTDESTIFGNGTEHNPLRLNIAARTGVYSPAELVYDKEDFYPGKRYLLREEVDPCGDGEFEWRYFIYDYDFIDGNWVSCELRPGERIILKEYLGSNDVEVICKISEEGSILEVYNNIKIDENSEPFIYANKNGIGISGITKEFEKVYTTIDEQVEEIYDVISAMTSGSSTSYKELKEKIDNVSSSLTEEIETRKQNDNALNEKINVVASNLSAETENRIQSEEELKSYFNEQLSAETQDRHNEIETLVEEVNSAFTEISESISGINENIEEIWEELNKKDDGRITEDITFTGKSGEIITIYSGTTVTSALTIIAEEAGGGDGKVKDILINDSSILDEETGIANLNILNADNDISVVMEGKIITIGVNGISNNTIVLN